jgi:deazaflavin-dependent oxidoreductase (nitroreductase family)
MTGARTGKAAGVPDGGGVRHGVSRRERVGLAIQRQLDKRLAPLGIWAYRRTKGGITRPWHVDALLLTTRGRRSGRVRTVILEFFRDGDAMVLAASNDGGATHPGWYFNLMARPTARVEVMGRRLTVRATELTAAEAAAFWPRIPARDPSYERYIRATDRTIPLVRLVPVDGAR